MSDKNLAEVMSGIDCTISENIQTNKTTIINKTYVKYEILDKIIKSDIKKRIEFISGEFTEVAKVVLSKFSSRFVFIEGIDAFFDKDQSVIFSNDPQVYEERYDTADNHYKYITKMAHKKINGLNFQLINHSEFLSTFKYDIENPLIRSRVTAFSIKGATHKRVAFDMNGNLAYSDDRQYVSQSTSSSWFRGVIISVCRLLDKNTKLEPPEIVKLCLSEGIAPVGLDEKTKIKYDKLCLYYKKICRYINISKGVKELSLDKDRLYEDVITGNFVETLFDLSLNYAAIREGIVKKESYLPEFDLVKQELLNCDFKRANISPYVEKQISDLNMGHWELFNNYSNENDGVFIDIPKENCFVARPPHMDIVRNGVCGIDFGTKSTVVACFKNEARLLRVGEGDFTKAPELTDYENPTVIEFRDFSGFCQKYAERAGRPYTEWEQLTVSHQAATAIFNNDKGNDNQTVFNELKQWAIDKKRRLMLCDRKGKAFEVKPYWELKETDFDPIEVYAYYLGLYINNMNNGIYLNYLLSFPVNYELDVRHRLLKSFEKGIKKSLPPAIINDSEIMEDFEICAGASEPAAYAISALQEFNLQPKQDGEKVCYGVFDFGGGTTDFDFGIQEIPANHRSRYVITQFGNGGDVYLGGENLLLLMAYEVYKDNLDVMRKNQIPFVLPPKGELFSGAETLIFNRGEGSQHAYLNSRRLAEQLRPIWERHEGYEETFGNESFGMMMFTNMGNSVSVQLKIDVTNLEKCIEKHIESGVENFFVAFRKAFKNKDFTLPIHIFLAGNSCKSPVVKKLFEKHIVLEEQAAAKNVLKKQGKAKSTDNCFVLHLPLGMSNSEVNSINNENNEEVRTGVKGLKARNHTDNSLEFDMMRTGKTGVVFGLLRSRSSARDVRILNLNNDKTEQVHFRYLLGVDDYGNVFKTVIGLDVPYGKWECFVPADCKSFELCYTSEPKALEGNMPTSKVNMVICKIDSVEVSDDENVFIRKIAPDKIQYAVGTMEDFTDFQEETFKHKIYTKVLEE